MVPAGTELTAVQLLAPTRRTGSLPEHVPAGDVEVVVDPHWLMDLHDPTLVISEGYVGPDRRHAHRAWDAGLQHRRRRDRFLHRVVQVAVMTIAVVVPLTLIVARSVPPAAPSTPPSASVAAPAAATAGHRSQAALEHQAARAEAAAERSAARTAARTEAQAGAAQARAQAREAAASRREARAEARASARAARQLGGVTVAAPDVTAGGASAGS